MIEKNNQNDWPSYKIIYELKKAGTSMAEIGAELGLAHRSIYDVCRYPWITLEAAIASRLRIHPKEIWPSRYDETGRPLHNYRSSRLPGTKAISEALEL
jgi:Ner family transcriptional regulator